MTDYQRFGDYDSSNRSAIGTALTFLFIGLGAGALSALLFAPKSGRQMRRTLRRKYEDAKDVFDELSDQAGDVLERGADWANSAKDLASAAKDWANTAKEKVAPIGRAVGRHT
jgi:gas vesicle protein